MKVLMVVCLALVGISSVGCGTPKPQIPAEGSELHPDDTPENLAKPESRATKTI